MNARFYNTNTGRFISQDSYSGNPYDPWTQHLYTYFGNNPTNMVDPTGHTPWWSNVLNFAQQAFQYAGNLATVDGPFYAMDIVSLFPIAAGIVSAAVAGVGYLVDEINTAISNVKPANDVIGGSPTVPWNPPSEKTEESTDNSQTQPIVKPHVTEQVKEMEEAKKKNRPVTVYRVYGDGSNLYGHSWTPNGPRIVENFRNEAGLPSGKESGVNNSGQYLAVGTLVDWTGVTIRPALPLDGNTGGGVVEFLVPNPQQQIVILHERIVLNPPV